MSLLAAAVLLSLAVAGGLLLGVLHARRAPVPFAAGLAHAGAAVAGIAVLLFAIATGDHGVAANAALLLFAIALVGGVFVLLFRLQRQRPPLFMVGLHGATALVALAVLWAAVP